MNEVTCDVVRDCLPEYASGILPEMERRRIEHHLRTCRECAAELSLVERIGASVPDPPGDLLERVQRAVERGRGRGRPAWVVPIAAAFALAAGTGILWLRASEPVGPSSDLVSAEALPSLWPSGDGTVAGVPLLEELSVEALTQLLAELEG